MSMDDEWVPFKERPGWDDITPVPQDDGPHPVVPINYTKKFKETMDYFRAILAKDERSARALELTGEVIGLNSANYTVWHFRRLVLEAMQLDLAKELLFMDDIADSNFKNYQFWQHRKWIAEKRGPVALSDELSFTEMALSDDAKNYHAWSHRQWVLAMLGGWEKELEFCNELLREDVFNNSAWNQRYFLLANDPSRGGVSSVPESEISYCLRAIEQAPENESSWRYLTGIFMHDKKSLASRTDVQEMCLKHVAGDNGKVQALNFLLNLLGWGYEPSQADRSVLTGTLGSWDSCGELAGIVCTRLEEVDAIRSRYWAWRRSTFPPSIIAA